jgi:hypothetical protein
VRRSCAITSVPRSGVGPCTTAAVSVTSTFAPILLSSPAIMYLPSKMVSLM